MGPAVNHVNVLLDDATVRKHLRKLHQPMCLFGEGTTQRRERLKLFLTENPEAAKWLKESPVVVPKIDTENAKKTFYTEGSDMLLKTRYKLADFSLRQCSIRLVATRIKMMEPRAARLVPQHDLIERIRQIQDHGSFLDDDMPSDQLKTITSCALNANASLLATSSIGGKCKLYSLPEMNTKLNLRGHKSLAKNIAFHPYSGNNGNEQSTFLSPASANLASCSRDGSVYLWSLESESPLRELNSVQSWMTTKVKFYLDGSCLATCCSDNSWRLYDVESNTEILRQDGHINSVHDIAFHPDGSLVATASFDNDSRIWDLRTGKCILKFEGHTNAVTSICFSPNGYHMATGSMDNSVKIWNLRRKSLEYTIPAHTKCVTKVSFEKENGYFLATSSLDTTVKYWSCPTWAPIKTLEGHDDKVADFEMSKCSKLLVTCYSKFIKIWSTELDCGAGKPQANTGADCKIKLETGTFEDNVIMRPVTGNGDNKASLNISS